MPPRRRMSGPLRGALEDLFGASLVGVRIHVEPAMRGLPAFSRGDEVHLGPAAGLHELAHELAHVLQHRAGRVPRGGDGALVVDAELEAEACAAADSVTRGRTFRIGKGPSRADASGPPAALPYTVLTPAQFAGANITIDNPRFHARAIGAPQPDIRGDTWPGQDRGGNFAGSPSSFLEPNGAVNLRSADPANTSLRLSQNGQMAVEDSDLSGRQAKTFYASIAILNASNARLELMGSHFRLMPNYSQTITVGGTKLLQVRPVNVTNQTFGLHMDAAQPCNSLIQDVLGVRDPESRVDEAIDAPHSVVLEYYVARELMNGSVAPLPAAPDPNNYAGTLPAIAAAYGRALVAPAVGFTGKVGRFGVNASASPYVGEGFLGVNLVATAPGAGWPPDLQSDHYHAGPGASWILSKDDVWNSHWAGVVARDGTDVVTLENYARSREDALQGNDTRFFFQMYNTGNAAQSWHAAWANIPQVAIPGAALGGADHRPQIAGGKLFTHLITLRITAPDARFSAIARGLYGTNVRAIQDDHALLAGAADADAQLRTALKGLAFADAHIEANRKVKSARVDAWGHALTTAYAANAFPENRVALAYAHARVLAVRRR